MSLLSTKEWHKFVIVYVAAWEQQVCPEAVEPPQCTQTHVVFVARVRSRISYFACLRIVGGK